MASFFKDDRLNRAVDSTEGKAVEVPQQRTDRNVHVTRVVVNKPKSYKYRDPDRWRSYMKEYMRRKRAVSNVGTPVSDTIRTLNVQEPVTDMGCQSLSV